MSLEEGAWAEVSREVSATVSAVSGAGGGAVEVVSIEPEPLGAEGSVGVGGLRGLSTSIVESSAETLVRLAVFSAEGVSSVKVLKVEPWPTTLVAGELLAGRLIELSEPDFFALLRYEVIVEKR